MEVSVPVHRLLLLARCEAKGEDEPQKLYLVLPLPLLRPHFLPLSAALVANRGRSHHQQLPCIYGQRG